MLNSKFEPDIVQITEQLSKRLNEKKKSIQEFLNILEQRAEIEDVYSKSLEKIGNELSNIVENTQQDSFTDIMQYVRNYLLISSEQSKELYQQLKNNVVLELQNTISLDQGWINEVNRIQSKHSREVRRNIEELHALQDDYNQALYEEKFYLEGKITSKKRNHEKSETNLKQFILYYNQYLDTYFQDIAYIQDIFLNIEIDRRKLVQDAGMKLFMYEISLIRNLQYDISGITQKIEQYKSNNKQSELLIIQTNDRPLLSKLNVENYILSLKQQYNLDENQRKKKQLAEGLNGSDQKKVDFIQANSSDYLKYNKMFEQALRFSEINDDIIKQLINLLQKTKAQQFYDAFISTIQKLSNQKNDYSVTPLGYQTCLKLSDVLLDYCNNQNTNAQIVINLLKFSKNIYKMLSVQDQENVEIQETIKFSLFGNYEVHYRGFKES
ncbi:unnamed protein product (macronuclear) [Paramecium tetraurelia]|uniref:FCH domain-containing protein n=1 Tax=Paramecium tetraurelia TaxID=5888 RepID=A0DK18_PARTE|nr:uncharacterized protein GSPATT00017729001 [Paramecium tetraurelia]CAK83385.1 unnamed protein product [Paramecium tetraurelia]|eukprot:XP_001450782.1 hypothetical protein (macronuclear) [Paramecium tetraurelia strain d4-2]